MAIFQHLPKTSGPFRFLSVLQAFVVMMNLVSFRRWESKGAASVNNWNIANFVAWQQVLIGPDFVVYVPTLVAAMLPGPEYPSALEEVSDKLLEGVSNKSLEEVADL